MSPKDDIIFGEMAVRSKMVTQEQIVECIKAQQALKEWKPLGSIMLEKGYITREQLHSLVDVQKRNIEAKAIKSRRLKEDNIFGKITLKLGFASEKQVDECLGVQIEMTNDYPLRLGEIMVKRGFLTEEQAAKVSDYQGKRLITCPKCGTNYNVILFNPGSKFVCYGCDTELATVKD